MQVASQHDLTFIDFEVLKMERFLKFLHLIDF